MTVCIVVWPFVLIGVSIPSPKRVRLEKRSSRQGGHKIEDVSKDDSRRWNIPVIPEIHIY